MSITDPGGGIVSGGVIIGPSGPGFESSPETPPTATSSGPADIRVAVPAPSRTFRVPVSGFFQSNEFTIHNGESLDFIADFGRWFDSSDPSDDIEASVVTLGGDSGFILGTKDDSDGRTVIQFVETSGAAIGARAEIVFQITTTAGRIKEIRIFIEVIDWAKPFAPIVLDPEGVIDVDFLWGELISHTASGDTIVSSTVTTEALPPDVDELGADSSLKSHLDATTVKQFVYGGTNGAQYWIICEIVMAGTRTARYATQAQVLKKAA